MKANTFSLLLLLNYILESIFFNYRSIITTDQDIEAADKLAKITETEDTNEYYFEMGVAKSNISGYTTNDVVTIDSKVFDFTWSTGDICKTTWGTFETFSPMVSKSNFSIDSLR
tara:strand:+ start:2019 stop:2360 length:342 start_codon:yes stop_codon:yes gene_type:complete